MDLEHILVNDFLREKGLYLHVGADCISPAVRLRGNNLILCGVYVSDADEACRIFEGVGYEIVAGNGLPVKPLIWSYETEAKIEVQDFRKVKRAVRKAEGCFVSKISEKNFLFDDSSGSLYNSGRLLRLRHNKKGDSVSDVLTYKGPVLEDNVLKVRPEHEVEIKVSDGYSFLEELGFGVTGSYAKIREKYRIMNSEVCLDHIKGIKRRFVEIEGPEREVWKIRDMLGLGNLPLIKEGYGDLVREC